MKPQFIKKAEDLRTKHRAIVEGFLAQALLKTSKAEPFVKEAIAFDKALKKVKTIDELSSLKSHRDDLASACGFSDKAKAQLTEDELNQAVKAVLARIGKVSGTDFREDILYRYLLTKGDTLGGSMRNVTGASAGTKLADRILKKLSESRIKVESVSSQTSKVQRIIWDDRVLLFDVTPRIIGKNIDVILLNSGKSARPEPELLNDKDAYIACGELKGGIDPAGADEHWKTASSALRRIKTAFGEDVPELFFVGAAIEASMAEEIFTQLKNGELSHAANLNEDQQVDDLVNWLVAL